MLIIIIIVVVLVAIVVGVLLVNNKSKQEESKPDIIYEGETGSESVDVDINNNNGVESAEEEVKETKIKNGVKLECDTVILTLTGYSLYTLGNKNYVTLFFDFTNPDDKPKTCMNNVWVDVFQNGIQIEENNTTPLPSGDAEDKSFTIIQKGATIHCARSYILDEPKGTITIHLSAFNYDYEKIVADQDLSIG